MKKGSFFILLSVFLAVGFASCNDDSTSSIGSSLTGSNVIITIDSTYTVSGKTIRVESIRPKADQLLLGSLSIENYGTFSSSAVAQFLPSTELDTANYTSTNVDSLHLVLRYALGNFIGDSIVPMGLTVYPLTKLLPNDIGSNFNPEGYYNKTPITSTTYNTLSESNPLNSAGNYHEIHVKMPTSLGRNIYKAFEDNPDNFKDGRVFAENVFGGVYMKSSFGSGRLTAISSTSLIFYLRKITPIDDEKNDTTDAIHQYMLVTPEVVSNNNLTYTMSSTLKQYEMEGKNLLVAPAGYEMELNFPAKEIVDSYRADGKGLSVLNSLTMEIPVDSIENNANVSAPPYLLLILKKDRDEFFAKNKLTDNITSFYASYDSSKHSYSFSALRKYLMDLLEKDTIEPEDYTFSLVPVQVNFEQMTNTGYGSVQYIETDIQPYLLAPTMCTVDLTKTKIKLTYSRQTSN